MKKIINNPNQVVSEMLIGLAKSNPKLMYSEGLEVISRKQKSGKVGVISGGGSGHEPAHVGYVGDGMLDAAVAGNVFSSPSPDRILEGIFRADSGQGVLIILKNYSGDLMNFKLAQELAEMKGVIVETVVVKDDVAVPESTYSTGRRGIAGTIFVHKVAGAAASKGWDLAEVKRAAQKAIDNTRSMGMAMTSCILPAVGKAGFTIPDDEIAIGMGIHGEPGISMEKIMRAKDLAKRLLAHILEDYDYKNSEVVVLVNGLGGTPLMELYIIFNEFEKILSGTGIRIYKSLVGNYMTSLEMSGCSISLMKVDEELKSLIDEPCNATALKMP